MRKIYKITIIFLLITIIVAFSYNVNATGMWSRAKSFLEAGTKNEAKDYQVVTKAMDTLNSKSKTEFEKLIGFLWGLGLLTIFISTVVLGMKYMFVDPKERSRIKQATTPYVVGVVIIFGALTIWQLVITILDGNL